MKTLVEPVKQERHDGEKEVRFPGAKMLLGGRFYIVPPLSIGQLETYKDLIAQARTMANNHDTMVAAMPLLHSAFSRNYPDMSIDEVKALIDLASFNEVTLALFNISGILKSEEEAAGEEQQSVRK